MVEKDYSYCDAHKCKSKDTCKRYTSYLQRLKDKGDQPMWFLVVKEPIEKCLMYGKE